MSLQSGAELPGLSFSSIHFEGALLGVKAKAKKKKKKKDWGHLLMLSNKKTILNDRQNLSKAVQLLYGPATAMRDPFMSGLPWPD